MPATPGTATAPAVLSVLRVQDLVPSILFLASFLVPFHFYSPVVWTWLEGYSAEQIFLLCPFLVPTAVFWSYSLVLAVLDLWRVPISFWRYRIQPTKSPLLGWYVKAGKQALFNWLFVNGPLGYIAYWVIVRIQQRDPASELLPTWPIILRDLLVFVLVEELGFYYSHRLFHHPRFYRRFHKRHHEFTAPIGLAGKLLERLTDQRQKQNTQFYCLPAIYAHPLEHLLANLLPLFAGPLLMQSHVLLFALWLTIGKLSS